MFSDYLGPKNLYVRFIVYCLRFIWHGLFQFFVYWGNIIDGVMEFVLFFNYRCMKL